MFLVALDGSLNVPLLKLNLEDNTIRAQLDEATEKPESSV